MTGQLIQYALNTLVFVTISVAVAGIFLAIKARENPHVNVYTPLQTLALIAAAAPYIGLFGTVWHIIQALSGLSTGDLNVAAIAKPIGEALYATLWGLGSAIPALIAHSLILSILPEGFGETDADAQQASHAVSK